MAKRRKSTRLTTKEDAHIGRKIAFAREEIGLSQAQLGELLGVRYQQISKYEDGRNRISARALGVIARRTGHMMEWFLPDAPAAEAAQ